MGLRLQSIGASLRQQFREQDMTQKTTYSSNPLELQERCISSELYALGDGVQHHALKSREVFFNWISQKISKTNFFGIDFLTLSEGHREILICALCHSSFVHENPQLELRSYERLEFLGDAVLDLLVSSDLIKKFESLKEGELSKLRGSLVNSDALASYAKDLDFKNSILLGKGEFFSQGGPRSGIMADIFESLIGAYYQIGGIELAKRFWDHNKATFQKNTGRDLLDLSNLNSFDVKTKLQEITMKDGGKVPSYVVIEQSENHFVVDVMLGNDVLGTGKGRSKKIASKEAAKVALTRVLNKESSHVIN